MRLQVLVGGLPPFVLVIVQEREVEPDIQPQDTVIKTETHDERAVGTVNDALRRVIVAEDHIGRLYRSVKPAGQVVEIALHITRIRLRIEFLQKTLSRQGTGKPYEYRDQNEGLV